MNASSTTARRETGSAARPVLDARPRWQSVGYWLSTILLVSELAVGGIWDLARIPSVRDLLTQLGYPTYFAVLLGVWKELGAVALLIPRRALLKEWAYAGTFFTYTGAIASHLTTGSAVGEVGVLSVFVALTAVSWVLRPRDRRLWAGRDDPGVCE